MIDQERINTRKCGSVFPSNGPETESILTTTLQQLQQVNTTLTLAPEDAATGGNLCARSSDDRDRDFRPMHGSLQAIRQYRSTFNVQRLAAFEAEEV